MFHYASITVNNNGKACQEAQSCPLGPLLCGTKHVTSRDMMNTPKWLRVVGDIGPSLLPTRLVPVDPGNLWQQCRLYPRPIGAAPPHIRPQSFPVWNIQKAGSGWQDIMFVVADKIASSAFYVAADVWTYKHCSCWGGLH